MPRANPDTLTALLRTLGTELGTIAHRLPPALDAMRNDTGGIIRSGGGGRPSGIADPTGDHVADGREIAGAVDLRRVERLVLSLSGVVKELDGIVAAWNPPRGAQKELRGVSVTNDDLWCPNPAHGASREPREPGKSHCWFCLDVRQRYGALPDAQLLDAKSRRRLNSGDIEAFLRRIGSTKRADVVEERSA